jgi:hypothetical protein
MPGARIAPRPATGNKAGPDSHAHMGGKAPATAKVGTPRSGKKFGCGSGAGGFKPGNTCATGPSIVNRNRRRIGHKFAETTGDQPGEMARWEPEMIERPDEEIGHVVYDNGSTVARLMGLDDWRVEVFGEPVPALASHFRQQYFGQYQGPEWGYYGQYLLQRVAEDVDGIATMTQIFPAPTEKRPLVY